MLWEFYAVAEELPVGIEYAACKYGEIKGKFL